MYKNTLYLYKAIVMELQSRKAESSTNIRFSSCIPYVELDSIEKIENNLRIICPRLKNETYPLLILMMCQKARFFLPIFYSLCKLLSLSCIQILRTLKKWIENDTHEDGYMLILLSYLEEHATESFVHEISEKFTYDTIVYCSLQYDFEFRSNDEAFLTAYEEFVDLRMQYWLEDVKEYLLICTFLEVKEVILWIAKYCFPAVCTSNNSQHFIWDPFTESWCENENLEDTLYKILIFVSKRMQTFMINVLYERKYWEEEHEKFWVWFQFPLNYETKCWESQVKDTGFKIHHDFHNVRQMKHKKFLSKLPIEYECANVPEFYLMEQKKLSFLSC